VPANGTLVVAGQVALVALTPLAPPPEVTTLTTEELEQRLAWQPRMLDFDDAPLSAIVAEFNRRNPVRLVIDDPIVANRRMTASFRSDNLDAFVRLLESNIGVQARHVGPAEIVLGRK
jgi:transmembrane sensor